MLLFLDHKIMSNIFLFYFSVFSEVVILYSIYYFDQQEKLLQNKKYNCQEAVT